MILRDRNWQLTGRSMARAWASLRLALRRLVDYESEAIDDHMDAIQIRATVAGQAGDLATLLRDQIDLLPDSRERLRGNWRDSREIMGELLTELRAAWDDLQQPRTGGSQ